MPSRKHASKGSILALKSRAEVTRIPKQGYQWSHKKDSCPPNFFLKNSCDKYDDNVILLQ